MIHAGGTYYHILRSKFPFDSGFGQWEWGENILEQRMFGNDFLLTFNESLGSAGPVGSRSSRRTGDVDRFSIPWIRCLSDSSDQIAVRFLGSDYLSDVMLTWIPMPYMIHLLVSHWIFSRYTLALKKINNFCNLNPNTS